MNVEIGTEAVQFTEKEYINGIFVAVYVVPTIVAGACSAAHIHSFRTRTALHLHHTDLYSFRMFRTESVVSISLLYLKGKGKFGYIFLALFRIRRLNPELVESVNPDPGKPKLSPPKGEEIPL
jgi:hypothetical protein